MTNRLAFITGVGGALTVFLLTVVGGANFPNYSHASRFISELGASGAPNARVINLAGFLPAGLLLGAFTFLPGDPKALLKDQLDDLPSSAREAFL